VPPADLQSNIRRFLETGDAAATTTERGRALEDLIAYLFEEIPGISLTKRNTLNYFQTEEIDLAFWNDKDPNGLYFLPYIILVECKNWSQPVGSIEVAWFDRKLQDRGLDFGILFAASGVTGDMNEHTRANFIIATALAQKRQLIVITRAELEVISSPDEIVRLIKEKITELVVGTTVFQNS
jgi:hypothetical protein